MNYKCSLSRLCRLHNYFDKNKIINFNYYQYGINSVSLIDTNNKYIACKLINDRALNEIFREKSIIINSLIEIREKNINNCLGYNKGKGIEIGVTFVRNNKIEEYYNIIAIILHEIVHCDISEHNNDFLEAEIKLRKDYIRFAKKFNQIKVWENINFPLSNGKYLDIDNINIIIKYIKIIKFIILALIISFYFRKMIVK